MKKMTYTGWKLKAGDTISETCISGGIEGPTYTYKVIGCNDEGVEIAETNGSSFHTHDEVNSWVTSVSPERIWLYWNKNHFTFTDEDLFTL